LFGAWLLSPPGDERNGRPRAGLPAAATT
jgi:hypothetical protein